MLFERFEGKTFVGYGCVITNTKKDIKDTITFQELQQNFGLSESEIYIDKVMANVKKRPVLNELIEKLEEYDRIYISDIYHLLGTRNKARDYYKKALEKGIELYIIDLSQTLFHLHPLSTLIPKNTSQPIKLDVDKKLEEFDKFAETYTLPKTAGRKKCYINNFTHSFKQLYFAYESYQIDLTTALERAKEFGVNNYPTFVNMVTDYEKSIDYHDDTLEYAEKDKDFITLPKRVIKRVKDSYNFPSEYLLIKEKEKTMENIDVSQIGAENNFLINEVIYQRYRLLDNGMKIPRKTREDVNIEF